MLHQNYPNPFNPITNMRYDLPEEAFVNITIYDMFGNTVKTLVGGKKSSGLNMSNGMQRITKVSPYLLVCMYIQLKQGSTDRLRR